MKTNTHSHKAFRFLAGILLVAIVLYPHPPYVAYASPLKSPTLIVNTEAFQLIDTGNGTDPIALRFGESANFIQYIGGVFRFSAGINVPGTISGSRLGLYNSTITNTGALYVAQYASATGAMIRTLTSAARPVLALDSKGSTAEASHLVFGYLGSFDTNLFRSALATLRTNGSFIVRDTISGSTINAHTLLTGATIQGFGLYNCNGTANKLTYNSTTKKFLCEADQTGGVGGSPEVGTASFSGATLRLGDPRYVKKAGDTMTGALAIQNGNTHSATSTPLLNVRGTMSGRGIYVTGTGGAHTPLLATDLRFGSLLIGTGSLKSGSGSMFPQLLIQGRLPSSARASVTSSAGTRIIIRGKYAYIAGSTTFGVYDVSNPLYPAFVGSVTIPSSTNDMAIEGKYAYIASEAFNKNALSIIDLSNPASPKLIRSYDMSVFSNNPFFGRSIAVQGRYAYITGYTDGIVYRLYTFDISDPNNAFETTSVAISSDTDRIQIAGRYLYLPRKTTGVLALYDLQNPAVPALVTTASVGTSPRSVVVQDKYAYVSNGSDATVSVVDISTPSSPLTVGTVTVGTTPKDMVIMGRLLYVLNTGTTTVSVVDVSNPRSPKVTGTFTVPSSPSSIDVVGRYAYVTTNASISVYDLGGAYIQQLEVGGIDTANALIRGDINVVGSTRISGGATIAHGLDVTGPTTVYGGTGASALFVGSTNRAGVVIEARGTPSADAQHLVFGYQGTFDTDLFRSTTNTLKTSGNFFALGTISGSALHATSRLTSSGVLSVHPAGKAEPVLFASGSQKVGINTGSPHSSLTSSGTFATSVRLVTATGSITEGDQIIFASGSSMITLTLPTAVGIAGRQYTIKKTSVTLDGNIRRVIVNTTSSQTIDRISRWILMNRGQQVTVVSDGSNWQVVDSASYGLNGGYMTMGATMNQWYGAPADATALTTAVLTTTATIRVLPFLAQKVMTINGMSVSVQTTAASAQVRLGLYRDSGGGYPQELVVDAGTVATTTTGHRTICPSGCTTTGDGTLPVTIQPGLYWIAINNNSIAHTLRGYAVANLNPVNGFPTAYTTLRNVGWQVSSTYTNLPTPFPSGATATTAVPLPAVTMRIQE